MTNRIILSMFLIWISNLCFAQVPELISFQTVIRDADNELLSNKLVGLRIGIVKDASNGSVVFSETHQVRTNANGLASLTIGKGVPVFGTINNVNWGSHTHFIIIESDLNGGNNYSLIGTQQLLSVPYALYAKSAGNAEIEPITLTGQGATIVSGTYPNFIISSTDTNTTYEAGAGIILNGTNIVNAAPDRVVTLSGAGSTIVTGAYPDFVVTSTGATVPYFAGDGILIDGTTIINIKPDQTVTLEGAGGAIVTGTYPDFIIETADGIEYESGAGIRIDGNTISNTAPDQIVTLTGTGSTDVLGSYPNFTINSTSGSGSYEAGDGIDINGNIISNTAKDKIVTIKGENGISVQGSYPDFSISRDTTSIHYVGEFYGGGIVFYTYDNGAHGLIVSLTDIGSGHQWNTGPSNTGASSHYDGLFDTNRIIAVQGGGNHAAGVCAQYAAGGFNDWYLPSIWELQLLQANGFLVNFKLENDGNPTTVPLNSNQSYWSSTEFDQELGYMLYFPEGTTYLDFKNNTYLVRALRRF